MQWSKPDFEEIPLAGEVTAYVNTDDLTPAPDQTPRPDQPSRTTSA